MTYSVESLVFRAVAGVVNTAARAANSLLEVMYPPRYDAAHIWDEPEQSPHEAAASADPHPAGVADPAAEKVNPPNLSAAGSPLATPTAQTLTEIYLGLSAFDLWLAASYVDEWAASDNCDDNPYHQVRLQDLATRLRDASRNLRINQ